MKKYTLTSERAFIINGIDYHGCALLYKNIIHVKKETPKSYKKVGGFICKNHGIYETGCVTIYQVGKRYAASLYKDGSFYPYFAFCELIK